ncbi:hypothetical protein HPB48_024966 [Haemaphysalis longicornis]|uniref:Neurotransmitter-gated ion-channel ligand-binding domain-containing protein n=1 Tax=Haemaphysalis longicornis TaxID=44386 RepID=A0A9J6H8Z3_HAELO|nr:hypothetical protein HPB48_024966 [Haemaphysalis longicornis]
MDCYFRQRWTDQRLKFNGTINPISLHIKMLERIWKPDTYFHNGKGSYLHTITQPNKLLRIFRNGDVLYSMRCVSRRDDARARCCCSWRSRGLSRPRLAGLGYEQGCGPLNNDRQLDRAPPAYTIYVVFSFPLSLNMRLGLGPAVQR